MMISTTFFSIPLILFFPLILLSLRKLDNVTFLLVAAVCLITDPSLAHRLYVKGLLEPRGPPKTFVS
jgi:hypothetical protein